MRRIATEFGVDVITSLDTLNAILKIEEKNIGEKKIEIFDMQQF